MSDRYTKAVLTIIAAALVGLLVQNAVGQSRAQTGGAIQKVQICVPDSGTGPGCVAVKPIPGIDFSNPNRFALEVAPLIPAR
ncbi:MAG: hypothetical protein JOZ16_03085 [Methylobacteriaceae bacterium]|nr:hypothetical protein [Methylobacteriaceae bacterium]